MPFYDLKITEVIDGDKKYIVEDDAVAKEMKYGGIPE